MNDAEAIRQITIQFLEKLGMPGDVNVREGEEEIFVSLDAGKNDALLIGRKGETLDAFEHLVRRMAAKATGYEGRIIVDISGYKERREKWLIEHARALADRASLSGEAQMTEPLLPRERRIIHLALADNLEVGTESPGEGSLKCVRIFPGRKEPGQTESHDQ